MLYIALLPHIASYGKSRSIFRGRRGNVELFLVEEKVCLTFT